LRRRQRFVLTIIILINIIFRKKKVVLLVVIRNGGGTPLRGRRGGVIFIIFTVVRFTLIDSDDSDFVIGALLSRSVLLQFCGGSGWIGRAEFADGGAGLGGEGIVVLDREERRASTTEAVLLPVVVEVEGGGHYMRGPVHSFCSALLITYIPIVFGYYY
jgi:hypothetical protein